MTTEMRLVVKATSGYEQSPKHRDGGRVSVRSRRVQCGPCRVDVIVYHGVPLYIHWAFILSLYVPFLTSWTSEDTLCVVLSRATISMVENAIIMAALFY